MATMASALQSVQLLSKKELVGVIEMLLTKYGDEGAAAVVAAVTKKPATDVSASADPSMAPDSKKPKKEFDMDRYRKRHIALQIQYEGEHYYGFTSQAGGCEETVEKHLFEALVKLKLIKDKHSCNYSRCGRTDRGVSALGQVVALNLRSSIPVAIAADAVPAHPGDAVLVDEPAAVDALASSSSSSSSGSRKRKASPDAADGGGGDAPTASGTKTRAVKEMDYCGMLNRLLPEHIRVLGWCEVTADFSSRFSAAYRSYRYFFVKKDLDVDKMNQAAALLVGDHDFRNICKMDVVKISNFRREVYFARVVPFCDNPEHPEQAVWMLEIRGIAFLWHMVRCIMAVLFMVGQGQEEPGVVAQLLDVERTPAKPHYQMAPELPLVLHECGFDSMRVLYQPAALWALSGHFEALWERHAVAAARARNALQTLRGWPVRLRDADEFVAYLAGKKGSGLGPGLGLGGAAGAGGAREGSDRPWADVLARIKAQLGAAPTDPAVPHRPLMRRPTNETYEERAGQLKGAKRERHERHLSLKESAEERQGSDFFTKMRAQGSVQGSVEPI